MSLRPLPRPEAAFWLSVGGSNALNQQPLITMATASINRSTEMSAKEVVSEKAVRAVVVKVLQTLELFSPEELRAEPEAISSFTALVDALCRLSERALKHQQYQDSRESARPGGKKRKNGLPADLIEQMHEKLNLL